MVTTDFETRYFKQVELLINVLPFVCNESTFAVKGGTAINLFVRDMPRLSVDIDLVYVPIEDRNTSLNNIESGLERIKLSLLNEYPNMRVEEKRTKSGNRLNKLFVLNNGVQIIVEPNEILRGTVYPTELKDLCSKAEELFELSVSDVPILSLADLYAGKICAALDRQHPRDLFDVKLLFENEGLTDHIRRAFVVYLASGPRPMSELLNPNLLDLRGVYEEQFRGMTTHDVTYDELLQVRKRLIQEINQSLTDNERQFLLSIKKGEPHWNLMDIDGLDKFPALQWKLININKMEPSKHKLAINKLEDALGL